MRRLYLLRSARRHDVGMGMQIYRSFILRQPRSRTPCPAMPLLSLNRLCQLELAMKLSESFEIDVQMQNSLSYRIRNSCEKAQPFVISNTPTESSSVLTIRALVKS